MRALVAAALLVLAAAPAGAWLAAGPNVMSGGHQVLRVPGGAAIDGFTVPTGAYGFRLLRTAYVGSGAALRIRRASDNLEADIGFSGGGDWDNASAVGHCAATSCFVTTWYDQSGNGRPLVQATPANQPQVIFNCIGSLACFQTTVSGQALSSAGSLTPATGIVSFSLVGNRVTSTTGVCGWVRQNGSVGNRVGTPGVVNQFVINGGTSGGYVVAAADGIWHSTQAVINTTSSALVVDGTTTTGTANGSVTAGQFLVAGPGAGTTCNQTEVVIWDNYVLTTAERAALTANQRAYWGF